MSDNLITYYLTLSQFFPKDLPNAGQETGFEFKLLRALDCSKCELSGWNNGKNTTDYLKCKNPCYEGYLKIHTIRANYDFWKKRFDKIMAGKACLSIRQWIGKPYGKGSKQKEICRLTCNDGIGIQKIELVRATKDLFLSYIDGKLIESKNVPLIAHNDGLDMADWFNWFSNYNLSKPMAIIHFTQFRYDTD